MSENTPLWKKRGFLIAVSAVVVLGLVTIIVLPMLLDVNRYRPQIEAALKEATGWDPDLGDVSLDLFPSPSVHVGGSSLASPRSESSIAIGSLDVAASFWPLFQGNLSIEDITLDAPRITLIRSAEDSGWDIPSLPGAEGNRSGTSRSRAPIAVTVRRIRVRNGSLHIEDRSSRPARVLAVEPFTTTLLPESGAIEGSAELSPDGGSLRWDGSASDGLTLTVEALATGRLATIVGSDLLKPGGTLSGTVDVGIPFAVNGALTGSALALSTGAQPVGQADLAFRVIGDDAGLILESTRLAVGGLTLEGRGRLTPALDLRLEIPEAPIETALEALRAVGQFPLDVEGPGTATVQVHVSQNSDGSVGYDAKGRMTARRLNTAEVLPPVDALSATFALTRDNRLVIDVTEGTVAGGPMRGKIRMAPVDPPGELLFDGTLRGASMGGLLAGFVADAAEKIVGPTSVQAALTVDLGRETLDAHAIGGTLKLSSGTITIPGWDVEGKIERELADRLSRLSLTSLLDQKTATQLGSSETPVAFDNMTSSLNLDRIPWSLEGLRLQRDGGALNGSGSFNPLDGTVAIDLQVELSTRRSAKLVEKYRSLKVLLDDDGHIRLPLELAGALDQPGISVDLGNLANEVLKSDDVKKDLVDKLKGLFDKDDD